MHRTAGTGVRREIWIMVKISCWGWKSQKIFKCYFDCSRCYSFAKGFNLTTYRHLSFASAGVEQPISKNRKRTCKIIIPVFNVKRLPNADTYERKLIPWWCKKHSIDSPKTRHGHKNFGFILFYVFIRLKKKINILKFPCPPQVLNYTRNAECHWSIEPIRESLEILNFKSPHKS